jgi:hypothetical protein
VKTDMLTNGLMKRILGFLAFLLLTSCGYHTGGHADLLPKQIKTIAIPAFVNITTRYKLTDRLPEAISREFITRTRYRVIPNLETADAILKGSVTNYQSFATVFDPATGRASGVEVHVMLQLSLIERATGKVLFSRPRMEIRERYQISTDATAFFEESDPAIERASQLTARQVVSAILEDF